MKNVAIIVGAGSGERFGSYKQVEIINNKPVYQYSIDAFLDTKSFSKIIIAVPKKLINIVAEQLAEDKYKDVVLCEGGDSRSHDAARPLIDKKTIINLIEFSKKEKAVILAKKITETVKSIKSNKSNFTVDRTNLWTSETPQVFNQEVLEEVYNKKSDIIHEYSDEAAIVEDCGYDVVIFENKNLNMKITSREDLGEITKRIGSDNFFGLGIDFHSLSKGDGIIVGGCKIKCDLKSIAHSDGDVLTHAIIDALCGALNLGDIGEHFPNTKQNKNISSIKLLEKIISMIPINISIVNVDATLVLNEPKISKYKSNISSNLATVLNISKNQISIKGSTTNRLNFIDMKNGWGAEVIITLKKWN
jgi:2-C-methyl-D-erythritol 2,4-cyclodiphosphate synthase